MTSSHRPPPRACALTADGDDDVEAEHLAIAFHLARTLVVSVISLGDRLDGHSLGACAVTRIYNEEFGENSSVIILANDTSDRQR